MRRLALVLLASAAPAAAATFAVPSVEEMARTSDAVVRGRVASVASRVAAGGRIVTDVEVAVASAWKGAVEGSLRLEVPGGSAGGIALKVDSVPAFAPGEEVVLFLSRRGGTWRLNGHALAKFRVEGTDARAGIEDARTVPRAVAAGERRVGTMPVGELERRTRAAR